MRISAFYVGIHSVDTLIAFTSPLESYPFHNNVDTHWIPMPDQKAVLL